MERLNIWPKPECDFVFRQNVLQIDVLAFSFLVCSTRTRRRGHENNPSFFFFLFFILNHLQGTGLHVLGSSASTANKFNQSLAINIVLEGNAN